MSKKRKAADLEAPAYPPPRANPDLQGHAAAEAILAEGAASGRLHHAWLITGPRGIGKATLAYRFARFLLAGAGKGEDAGSGGGGLFGEALPSIASPLHVAADHPVFRRVVSGGHADLMTIERSWDEKKKKLRAEIVVDDVREVGGFLAMTPAEGGWRVVVVDAADEMNRNAANALLKVLEEPPRQAILLLVAHNPGRLLPTIRSRCRKLTLKPLDTATVVHLIGRYRPETSPEEAAELARLSGGSIGRALELAGGGGLGLYQEVTDLLDALPGLDVAKLHKQADALARAGAEDSFRTAVEVLKAWLAARIKASAVARRGALDPRLEVWDKIDRLFRWADGSGNLDRKQVWLSTVLALQATAGPGRR